MCPNDWISKFDEQREANRFAGIQSNFPEEKCAMEQDDLKPLTGFFKLKAVADE